MTDENDLQANDLEFETIQSETEDSESAPPAYEINSYPADYTLEVLFRKWQDKEIIIPPFQRGYVWNIRQASRLIESFMLGLPVPQIFLYEGADKKSLIIDGQQRLKTIFFFFEGYFGEADKTGKRKEFGLAGLDQKSTWLNKKFTDFSPADQRKLKDAVLRSIKVKQMDPKDDTSIYHIFERLNTGGTLLRPQEVRNCIYWGTLNDLLVELNNYPTWRLLLGWKTPAKHQKDMELILRYLSLFHHSTKYFKPMKDFMNNFMKSNRNPSAEFVRLERERFTNTCNAIKDSLGERPFILIRGINAPVFEAVFLAFSKNLDKIPANIKERYESLKHNDEFIRLCKIATTDVPTVHSRLNLAEKVLFM